MSQTIGHTLADDSDTAPHTGAEILAPQLYVLLEGDRPLALSSRHSLQNVATVILGRTPERWALRPASRRRADLELGIPDRRMSGNHAVMTRVRGEWIIEDSSSKNGTRVNGTAIQEHALKDGDLLELGRTILVYRESMATSDVLDADAKDLAADDPQTLLVDLAEQLAKLRRLSRSTEVSLLIEGESGTGKEVLARQVANWSARPGAFVAVNCGALAPSLIESELFGATKGAFSGATADRVGLVRSAHRGCLFLDEIADLPSPSQAALLRVLQEREVLPVGATKPVPVDIRVLAATHRDLRTLVAEGGFRQDLFARIAGFPSRLPPLRDRREDIGLLTGKILNDMGDRGQKIRISPESIRALYRYAWPLNIRELYTTLNAAVLLADNNVIQLSHLPENVRAPQQEAALERVLTAEETAHKLELIERLREHHGNVSAVARDVAKARTQVQRWMKRYNLRAADFKK